MHFILVRMTNFEFLDNKDEQKWTRAMKGKKYYWNWLFPIIEVFFLLNHHTFHSPEIDHSFKMASSLSTLRECVTGMNSGLSVPKQPGNQNSHNNQCKYEGQVTAGL